MKNSKFTDHRAEAKRLMSAIDSKDWSDTSPAAQNYITQRTSAAQVHALLYVGDMLADIQATLDNQGRNG